MKKVRVTIMRKQETDLVVADETEFGPSWPNLSYDDMLVIQSRAQYDSTTVSITAEVVEDPINPQ